MCSGTDKKYCGTRRGEVQARVAPGQAPLTIPSHFTLELASYGSGLAHLNMDERCAGQTVTVWRSTEDHVFDHLRRWSRELLRIDSSWKDNRGRVEPEVWVLWKAFRTREDPINPTTLAPSLAIPC